MSDARVVFPECDHLLVEDLAVVELALFVLKHCGLAPPCIRGGDARLLGLGDERHEPLAGDDEHESEQKRPSALFARSDRDVRQERKHDRDEIPNAAQEGSSCALPHQRCDHAGGGVAAELVLGVTVDSFGIRHRTGVVALAARDSVPVRQNGQANAREVAAVCLVGWPRCRDEVADRLLGKLLGRHVMQRFVLRGVQGIPEAQYRGGVQIGERAHGYSRKPRKIWPMLWKRFQTADGTEATACLIVSPCST